MPVTHNGLIESTVSIEDMQEQFPLCREHLILLCD